MQKIPYYEFFAGGGLARAGLGRKFKCLLANDIDPKKAACYRANWGDAEFKLADVATLNPEDLPEHADLVWASFPCQDLSQAGAGAGLSGERSGTFWPFWRLMKSLVRAKRAPKMIVLENVCGALTSHGGRDFTAISSALTRSNYRFGGLIVDAASFVPQSRPRLFILAVRSDVLIPHHLTGDIASEIWSTSSLRSAHARLPRDCQKRWIWWRLPRPWAPLSNARRSAFSKPFIV